MYSGKFRCLTRQPGSPFMDEPGSSRERCSFCPISLDNEQGFAGPMLNEPKRAYTLLYAHSQPLLMFQTHGLPEYGTTHFNVWPASELAETHCA